MIIIIDGVDKSGKSTLAEALAKKFSFKVIKGLKPKKNPFIECVDFLTETKENVIIDRFYLSEVVYGPLKTNPRIGRDVIGSRFDFRQEKIIEMLCRTLNTFNVLCWDTEDRLGSRFKECNETFLSTSEISSVLEGFDSAVEKSLLTWNKYKTEDSYEELFKKIEKHFQEHNEEQRQKYVKYRTLGDIDNAEYLIVGERYGPGLLLPLVPFGNNYPGELLFEAINFSGVKLKNCLITNVYKGTEDDEAALVDELSLPSVKKIICLGDTAYSEVLMQFIKYDIQKPVRKVPHPSFWVRSGKSADSYAKNFY